MSRARWAWLAVWAATVGATLVARPPWPVDETRYLAVAWRMWVVGDLVVPRLGAELYHDKPPLLFWLVHAGWAVAGVSVAWARIVPPLFGLASLALTGRLARRLWPDDARTAALGPLILAGALFWSLWSTLLMFDTLVCCFALLALLAVVAAVRGAGARAHVGLGLALGAGLLAKGPVLLLYVAPAALLAPLWARETRPARWRRYYAGLAGALALGIAPALAWMTAATHGAAGLSQHTLLVDQTLKRLVGSAEHLHVEPWWYYLVRLPLLALPWTLWPPLWSAARRRLRRPADDGLRLVALWAAAGLLVASAIPAKQVHYLLPLFPALALLAARALAETASAAPPRAPRRDALLPALLPVGAGATLLAAAFGAPGTPDWARNLDAWPGSVMVAAGLGLACLRSPSPSATARRMTLVSGLLLVTALCGVLPALLPTVDVRPAARRIAEWQGEGRPIASVDKVRGEYDFAGRLREPIVFLEPYEVAAWAEAHPDGVLLTTDEEAHAEDAAPPLAALDNGLRAWDARTLPERIKTRHRR